MARTLDAVIAIRHGETCTCTPLDPITTVTEPVLVNPDCPRQREVPRTGELRGRVILTWPAARDGAPLPVHEVAIHDYDTGSELRDVLALRLIAGGPHWRGLVTVELAQLVGEDGQPLGPRPVVSDEDAAGYRTDVFRYAVAEMRVAAPA